MVVPKFRAYDKKWQEWLTDLYIGLNGKLYQKSKDTTYGVAVSPVNRDNITLMQSTGLFDKNGKEIFEGDVVALQYTISSVPETFKVTRFRGGSWRIDNRARGCELWLRNQDCEVVGNIYENPELVTVD